MRQEMEYIYAVYHNGSLSKAAEKLYVTQPALSMAIKKIESAIGMALFDRSKRPLALTEAGRLYIDSIARIQQIEEELQQQISDISELKAGRLRIGGSHYINAYILPSVLTRFSRLYPGVTLELVEHSSAVLSQMLEERRVDLTFSCNEQFMKDFERYPVFYDHILLALHEAHPFNQEHKKYALTPRAVLNGRHLAPRCPVVPVETFKDLEFITLSSGNNLHDRVAEIFAQAGAKIQTKLELAQLATAYHLAENSFAATFVSDRMVNAASPLRFYKIQSSLTDRLFYILLPHREYTSRAVQSFIAHFRENM